MLDYPACLLTQVPPHHDRLTLSVFIVPGGVSPDSDSVTKSAMTAVGVDGRTMTMSTAAFDLEVVGVSSGGEKESGLKSNYKGQCCIGDLPAFAALGAEKTPFMSMGLDVLGRGRTVLDLKNNKLYLTPGGAVDGGYV